MIQQYYNKVMEAFKLHGNKYKTSNEYLEAVKMLPNIPHTEEEMEEEDIVFYEFSISNGRVQRRTINGKVFVLNPFHCLNVCVVHLHSRESGNVSALKLEVVKPQSSNYAFKVYSLNKNFDYESLIRDFVAQRQKELSAKIADIKRISSKLDNILNSLGGK